MSVVRGAVAKGTADYIPHVQVDYGLGQECGDVPYCTLSDWESIDELLDFRNDDREESPGTQLLYITDDFGQALYQSGHATNLFLPSALDLREYSAIMVGWLRRQLVDATLDVDSELIPIDDSSIDLLGLLENTDRLFRAPLRCFRIETDDPSMAIAAVPNGYFTGDLTPAQNYLLAEQLRQDFGLEIFGLGSDSAVYCRTDPISAAEADAMVGSVKEMYNGMTETLAEAWAAKTVGERWFLVSYRGA